MKRPHSFPVLAGGFSAFVVSTLFVLPEYRRVRAIDSASATSAGLTSMDALTMASLSVGAATILGFLAVLFVTRVRRESLRVIGGLVAPAALGFLSAQPAYYYVYRQFPGADHVSIPAVYRWSGPAAIAAALIIWGLLHLCLRPTTTATRAASRPEA